MTHCSPASIPERGTARLHIRPLRPLQVEKSLSVDNLFVFLMIFEYFKVPEQHTQRVLK
jgi:predicted tellurium resistance membrane protein TerC